MVFSNQAKSIGFLSIAMQPWQPWQTGAVAFMGLYADSLNLFGTARMQAMNGWHAVHEPYQAMQIQSFNGDRRAAAGSEFVCHVRHDQAGNQASS